MIARLIIACWEGSENQQAALPRMAGITVRRGSCVRLRDWLCYRKTLHACNGRRLVRVLPALQQHAVAALARLA